jgi:hypothetical protein
MTKARDLARLSPNSSGLLPDANLAAIAASKLTGQVPDANAPSESVIQVVQTVMTTTAQISGSTWNDVTPLTTTITPSSSTSRILIMSSIDYACGVGYRAGFKIMRGGSDILLGDSAGSRIRATKLGRFWDSSNQMTHPAYITYLDSPATTSAVTYRFYLSAEHDTGGTIYVNRTVADADSAQHYRGTSTVILMEIRA